MQKATKSIESGKGVSDRYSNTLILCKKIRLESTVRDRITNIIDTVSSERATSTNSIAFHVTVFRDTVWHDKAMKCSRIKRNHDSTSPSSKLIRNEPETGVNFLTSCKLQIKRADSILPSFFPLFRD